jgi:diacylglycerol kinase
VEMLFKAAKHIVIGVFCVFCLWKCSSKLQKHIVIGVFCVFCLWKCSSKLQKHIVIGVFLCVLFVEMLFKAVKKNIFRLWIQEISTYSFFLVMRKKKKS